MSKRTSVPDDDSSSSASKKRVVSVATVDKWVLDHDKTLNTATWLTYEKADRHHVALLLCSVCKRFEERIKKSRNFSPAFIDGTRNLRTSSFNPTALFGTTRDLIEWARALFGTISIWPTLSSHSSRSLLLSLKPIYNRQGLPSITLKKIRRLCTRVDRHDRQLLSPSRSTVSR